MNDRTNSPEPSAAKGNRVLYIACKAPTGLLLEIGNKGEKGYRMTLLKGANEGVFRKGDGMFISTAVNGYGLTTVSTDFYEAWLKTAPGKNLGADWAEKRLIVVCESKDEAEAAMNDGGDVVTGFEPINPDKLPIKGLERTPVGSQVE